MYINFKVWQKSGLSAEDIFQLAAIKQKDREFINEDNFSRFEELNLIKYVKVGKTALERVRIDKKGESLLEEISIPEVEEQDVTIFEWLSQHYKKLGKDIGNGARTKRHIRDFRVKSGIEKNNLIKLCLDFLKENEEQSRVLEYVFYYPKTVYATKFSLDDSWLYKHYIKNQERIEKTFENE